MEFLFDFASPNCYVTVAKTDQLWRKNAELQVVYSPILLGGLFKLTGDAPVPTGSHEFNYMENNLRRLSKKLGIDFRFSRSRFPVNSLKAMRGYYFAQSSDEGVRYMHRIFRACWGDDLDISDLSVLQREIRAIGFDDQEFAKFIEREEIKLKLKEATQRAFDRRVFGAPTLFFDGQMYWEARRFCGIWKRLC
jgi:2-hydroxychromene-2-carboxylate isomerase